LLRDALFALARSQGGSSLVAQVRSAFALAGTVPADFEVPRYGAVERKLRARAGAALVRATGAWDRAARGQVNEIAVFVAALEEYASAIADFGIPGMVELAQAVLNAGRVQADSKEQIDETLGIEVAMALLFSEAALEAGLREFAGTDARSREMASRLTAIVAGDTLSAMPSWLHELAASTHERRTMAAFVGELLVNLRSVEKMLDAYFRDPAKRTGLEAAIGEIRQVGGALRLLDCIEASAAADAIRGRIEEFNQREETPESGECEALALDVGALGFFIEDLRNPGREAASYHLDGESGHFRARMIDASGEGFPASDLDAGWSAPVVHAMAPAEFGPQSYLDEQPETPLDESGSLEIKAVTEPEPAAISQGSIGAAFDSELLQVFLAEAREVLETVEREAAALAELPSDQDLVTTLRRSFHTLKGSSRMVGLGLFGEAAWAVEQVLNLCLAESRTADQDLFGLLDRSHSVFSSWLVGIEQGTPWGEDAAELIAAAGTLRDTARLPATARGELVADSADDGSDISSEWSDATPDMLSFETADASDFETIEIVEPAADMDAQRSLLELGGAEYLDLDANSLNVRPIVDMGREIDSTWSEESPEQRQRDLLIGGRPIREKLYRVFLAESDESLATLLADADEWHSSPLRPAGEEAQRCAHTLKGSASVVGLAQVHEVAELIESFLTSQAASGVGTSPEDRADYWQLVERLQAMLHQFAAGAMPSDEPETLLLARTLAGRWNQAQSAGSAGALAAVTERAAEAAPEGPVCIDEFDLDLLPIFVEEAEEWLPAVGEHLLDWRARPLDRGLAQWVMRALHTVKGSARMAGAMTLGQRVHELEANVEAVAAPEEAAPELIEALITRHDELMVLFESIARPGSVPPELAAASSVAAVPAPLAGQPEPGADCQTALEAAPVESTSSQALESSLTSASDAASCPGAAQPQQPLVRVRADTLDDLVNQAGEVSIARSRIDNSMGSLRQSLGDLAENVARLRSQLREIEIQAETQIQARLAQQRESQGDFDPLEFDRFTRLQELTRMLAESVNDVATVQQGAFRSLDEASQDLLRQGRVLRELQHDLMRVRMVPFGSASDRMYRVVRQTAKQLGKRVTLEITGGGVELDRGVLERMAAPIEHLLRNSVAHGIEAPEARAAAGKPETGEITIEVRQEGNEVMLLFADDGAGLNFERIRERAIEVGLARREQLLNDATLAGMILMPGFSTQTEVNEISGRGVGLNVVDEEVSALGGRITIDSGRGTGTSFTIHLPLTLAISQVVIVTVGPLQYAVPSTSFEQVLQLRPQALAQAYKDGAIEWQGARVPLYYLATLVDAPDLRPVAQHYSQVVVLHSAGQRIAVHVDSVGRNQEVVVKNVGRQVARVRGVSGATVMGNGDIVLILNPGLLAQQVVQGVVNDAAMVPGTPALEVAPPTVMVVDDSLTVRKVTERLLKREGFAVLLAKDGLDALRQTEDVLPDVFLVDIEMPRMDGFDLTSALRGDPRTAEAPIVMITSRTAEKHRGRALELGVDVFLGKPYRDEELMGHIRRLIKAAEVQRAAS
ncbi:MAG: Hpt domain-containing protein, partial [Burkholderiaceae bacterium]|nr:Hpt domain-containing protein [Burkholderiaceae bacterium]